MRTDIVPADWHDEQISAIADEIDELLALGLAKSRASAVIMVHQDDKVIASQVGEATGQRCEIHRRAVNSQAIPQHLIGSSAVVPAHGRIIDKDILSKKQGEYH